MTKLRTDDRSQQTPDTRGRSWLLAALLAGVAVLLFVLTAPSRELADRSADAVDEIGQEPSTGKSEVLVPVQTKGVQALNSSAAPIILRHDLKTKLTWLTLKPTDTWTIWPDHMSGLTISSETPEDIASWYGQTPTRTWGVFHISISNEPGGEFDSDPPEGSVVTTTNTTIGGYCGVRRDVQDSAGRIDASVAVTLPTGVVYAFNTQVAGTAGAEAAAMRAELDRMLDSASFVPDSTTEVAWTRSSVVVPSTVGKGFDVAHPTGWTVADSFPAASASQARVHLHTRTDSSRSRSCRLVQTTLLVGMGKSVGHTMYCSTRREARRRRD